MKAAEWYAKKELEVEKASGLTLTSELLRQLEEKRYRRVSEFLKGSGYFEHRRESFFKIAIVNKDKNCAICKNIIAENTYSYKRIVYIEKHSCNYRGLKHYTFYICSEGCVERAIQLLQNSHFALFDFIIMNEYGTERMLKLNIDKRRKAGMEITSL